MRRLPVRYCVLLLLLGLIAAAAAENSGIVRPLVLVRTMEVGLEQGKGASFSFSCFFSAPACLLLVPVLVLVPRGVMAASVASRLISSSSVCSEPTSREEPVEAKKRSRLFFNWRVLGSRVRLRRRLGDSSLIVPLVYTLLLISGSRSRCCFLSIKTTVSQQGASFLLSSRRCCCCVLTGWMLGARQQNSRAGCVQTRQRQKVRHPEAPTSSRNVRGAPPPPASPVT